MKIAQSNVNLVSTHQYYEDNTVTVQSGVVDRDLFLQNLQEQGRKQSELETSNGKELGKRTEGLTRDLDKRDKYIAGNLDRNDFIRSDNYNYLNPSRAGMIQEEEVSIIDQLEEIRASMIERILELLDILSGGNPGKNYRHLLHQTSSMIASSHYVSVTTVQMAHVEEEETTFSGKGMALTEDGRSIDFNIDFSLSRRFVQYADMEVSARAVNLVDPLIINVGSGVTSISDQSFFFDIDSDGKEDKISSLRKGSGFLAYDRNGDGIINNGNELFGARSGNGFKDLAKYDSDRNGWIDENDEIYDLLKVWLKNEDGTDTLLSLKEADVGAIYLGNVATEHTHQNSEDFGVTAMMRSSGLFLKESGGVGTVQQVDLARL
ncbi:hypothetical protein [Butyrivibrio sp. YAB3001]|uniref:hypothetical protein n=1 Tax=Butyrivibrio sp. YAB3001 TaxID=1520812 RepID=UPI0008F639DE|nr:hypothetical protein [Butyrivibrio sp. YAB3001]SFB95743.1 hypothetical protein SAMN02910398_01137 [Butyrivibrio sp. YAB3001]